MKAGVRLNPSQAGWRNVDQLIGKSSSPDFGNWTALGSRSDLMMVAVGFSPRTGCPPGGVAERRLNASSNCAVHSVVAPRRKNCAAPIRGLKPTATFRSSLREAGERTFPPTENIKEAFARAAREEYSRLYLIPHTFRCPCLT